jgi:hypothetical protein
VLEEVELIHLAGILFRLRLACLLNSLIFDQYKEIFIFIVIDCIWIGLVYGDYIFNIFSNVVNSTSKDYQLHHEAALLIVSQVENVLGYSLPIEVIVRALREVDADVDVLGVEYVLNAELDLQL